MKAIIDYKIYEIDNELIGFYILEVDGKFKYMSQRLENVLKYSEEMGIKAKDLVVL